MWQWWVRRSSRAVVIFSSLKTVEAGQVLIVQHRRGEVVSITQTVYDANGDVVYGRSGVGDVIRECVLPMTTSEKSAGRERCKK